MAIKSAVPLSRQSARASGNSPLGPSGKAGTFCSPSATPWRNGYEKCVSRGTALCILLSHHRITLAESLNANTAVLLGPSHLHSFDEFDILVRECVGLGEGLGVL